MSDMRLHGWPVVVNGHVCGDELKSWLDQEDEVEPIDQNTPNPHKAGFENKPVADDSQWLLSLDIAFRLIASD